MEKERKKGGREKRWEREEKRYEREERWINARKRIDVSEEINEKWRIVVTDRRTRREGGREGERKVGKQRNDEGKE